MKILGELEIHCWKEKEEQRLLKEKKQEKLRSKENYRIMKERFSRRILKKVYVRIEQFTIIVAYISEYRRSNFQ